MARVYYVRPDGSLEVRGIWTDDRADRDRKDGFVPERASHIEAIPAGPHAGYYHVDFTPLAELRGRPDFCICLLQTFAYKRDAAAVEVAWIKANDTIEGEP